MPHNTTATPAHDLRARFAASIDRGDHSWVGAKHARIFQIICEMLARPALEVGAIWHQIVWHIVVIPRRQRRLLSEAAGLRVRGARREVAGKVGHLTRDKAGARRRWYGRVTSTYMR